MNDNQACCAHCKIVLKHKDYPNGTRSDYWECADGCGTMFWPDRSGEDAVAVFSRETYDRMMKEQDEEIAKLKAEKVQAILDRSSALMRIKELDKELDEIARLKRGDFTKEEFQNLCHNRHEKEGCTAQDFFNGCAEYQKSLFGTSERETKTPPQHNHGGEPAPASSAQREELNQ